MQTNTAELQARTTVRPSLAAVSVQPHPSPHSEADAPAAAPQSVVSQISDKQQPSVYYVNSAGNECPDKLTQETVEAFKNGLTSYMLELSQQYGIALNKLSINLSDDAQNLDITLKASTINFHGMDRYAIEYLKLANSIGFKPEWIGKTFTYKTASKMVLTGYDSETNRIRVFSGTNAIWVRNDSFKHLIELITYNDFFQ